MSRGLSWLLAGAAFSTYAAAGAALAAEPKSKAEPKPWIRELPRGSLIIGGPDGENRVFVMRHGGDRTQRLAMLLQLRAEQEPALKAYLDALKPSHDHRVKFEPAVAARLSTPERLAQMEAQLAEQQAAGKARIAATRAFYAQLDARQQKVFDELPLIEPGFGHMPTPPAPIMHRLPTLPFAGPFHHELEIAPGPPGV